jgi:hypothetical protein
MPLSDTDNIQEIDALISEVKKLLREILKIKSMLFWLPDCPLEAALRINELVKWTEEFYKLCCQYYNLCCYYRACFYNNKSVSETDMSNLRENYKRLKEAWLEFLAKNRLGLIYL